MFGLTENHDSRRLYRIRSCNFPTSYDDASELLAAEVDYTQILLGSLASDSLALSRVAAAKQLSIIQRLLRDANPRISSLLREHCSAETIERWESNHLPRLTSLLRAHKSPWRRNPRCYRYWNPRWYINRESLSLSSYSDSLKYLSVAARSYEDLAFGVCYYDGHQQVATHILNEYAAVLRAESDVFAINHLHVLLKYCESYRGFCGVSDALLKSRWKRLTALGNTRKKLRDRKRLGFSQYLLSMARWNYPPYFTSEPDVTLHESRVQYADVLYDLLAFPLRDADLIEEPARLSNSFLHQCSALHDAAIDNSRAALKTALSGKPFASVNMHDVQCIIDQFGGLRSEHKEALSLASDRGPSRRLAPAGTAFDLVDRACYILDEFENASEGTVALERVDGIVTDVVAQLLPRIRQHYFPKDGAGDKARNSVAGLGALAICFYVEDKAAAALKAAEYIWIRDYTHISALHGDDYDPFGIEIKGVAGKDSAERVAALLKQRFSWSRDSVGVVDDAYPGLGWVVRVFKSPSSGGVTK